jgi:hypothetical protein
MSGRSTGSTSSSLPHACLGVTAITEERPAPPSTGLKCLAAELYTQLCGELPAPVVHHRVQTHTITCAVRPARRDPGSSAWPAVTCGDCLAAGFVEVRLNRWTVHEKVPESVLLVLEGASSVIARNRRPKELRYPSPASSRGR